MTTPNEQTILDRAHDLHRYIAEGRIIEGLEEFYAENVLMQENTDSPCVGREQNKEREEAWLATVKEWKGFEVVSIAVEGSTTFAETTMDYVTQDGQEVHMEQVARAKWKDGRIVDERFYHA